MEAASELITVAVITAIPFAIGLFSFILLAPGANWDWPAAQQYLSTVFLRGQLFLIAVSFLATALYRLFGLGKKYRRPDILVLFSLVLFGVIGIYYGKNPSFAAIESDFARNISIIFLVISLVFYYYLAVLANEEPPSVAQSLDRQARSLGDRLKARRSGEAGEG